MAYVSTILLPLLSFVVLVALVADVAVVAEPAVVAYPAEPTAISDLFTHVVPPLLHPNNWLSLPVDFGTYFTSSFVA